MDCAPGRSRIRYNWIFEFCKGVGFVSLIRLLIATSDVEAANIDASVLCQSGIAPIWVECRELSTLAGGDFDVVLLTGSLDRDNLALIGGLRESMPQAKFITILGYQCARAAQYLQSGVSGLLAEIPESKHLAEIVREIDSGAYHLDADIAQMLAMRQIKKMLEPFTLLSSREFDVFCLLAEGGRLQDIAEQLGISSKTVSNCQTQIKLKLGLENRGEIKRFAFSHGLISNKSL